MSLEENIIHTVNSFLRICPIKEIDFNNPIEKTVYEQVCSIVKSIIDTKSKLAKISIYAKQRVMHRKLNRLHTDLFRLIDNLYGFTQDDIDCITGDNLFIASMES